jgi:hypothetical protein
MIKKLLFVVGFAFLVSGCSLQPATPSATPTPASPTQSEVQLQTPQSGQVVTSPLQITGSAPGTWFFEAQILGKLLDENGAVIAQTPLMAEGEWMTTEMVPFSGEISFSKPAIGNSVTLVIENDNPSGLPEHSKSFSVPLQLSDE